MNPFVVFRPRNAALLFVTAALLLCARIAARADWYDGGWLYRSTVTVYNHSSSGLSDYQILITTNTKALYDMGMMKSGGADLRFTKADQTTVLPYWIETPAPNTATSCNIWVKVSGTNSLPAASSTTIYMYYGNTSAVAVSSGPRTFEAFDDFTYDTWTISEYPASRWNTDRVTTDSYSASYSCRTNRSSTSSAAIGDHSTFTKSINVGTGSRKARVFLNDTYTTTNASKRYKQLYVGSVNCLDEDISGGSSGWTGTTWADITSQTGSQNVYFRLYDKAAAAFTCTVYWDEFMIRKSTVSEPNVTPSHIRVDCPSPGVITSLTALAYTASSARLTWTAPGDTGYAGNVTGGMWEIRFTSVTTETADMAQYALLRSSSYVQGAAYSDIVTGLIADRPWWFWVRARDGEGNWSGWSSSNTCAPAAFTDIGAGLTGVRYSMLSWADYDNDGDLDLCSAGADSGGVWTTKIYKNSGGSFSDSGISLTGIDYGAMTWGDYDLDGDLDLVISGRYGSSQYITRFYRNTNGSFTDIGSGVRKAYAGSMSFGDYDNDGDLDLVVGGWDAGDGGNQVRLFNNNNGVFTNVVAGIGALQEPCLNWGDCDNDGDLDLAITGLLDGAYVTKVYRNDSGNFTALSASIDGGYIGGSVAWGDYDNDGKLDLAVAGHDGTAPHCGEIYRNKDGASFTDQNSGIETGYYSAMAWGDYDNDGDLDLLYVGHTGSAEFSRLYKNSGGTFSDSGIALEPVHRGAAAWGDYDNDGDLDLAISGEGGSYEARIYRNNASPNTAPSAPSGLEASCDRDTNKITLLWNRSTDAETPEKGLGYEVRAATISITDNISKWVISPSTGAGTGSGNGQLNPHGYCVAVSTMPGMILSGITTSSTYYFQVRAVDTGFMKSAWSSVKSFCPDLSAPPATRKRVFSIMY